MNVLKEKQILKTLNKATEQINDFMEQSKVKDNRAEFNYALKALDLIKKAKSGFDLIISVSEGK